MKQISVKTSMSDEINLVGNIMSHETQININGKFALPQLLYNFDIWETKFWHVLVKVIVSHQIVNMQA